MPDQLQLKLLRHGSEAWNAWRKANRRVKPDLRGAKLGHAHLTGADMANADFSGADLHGADLSGAVFYLSKFNDVDLSTADLSRAEMASSDFRGAVLSKADLSSAVLYDMQLQNSECEGAAFISTKIERCDLSGANLQGANLEGAIFLRAVLQQARLHSAHLYDTVFQDVDLSLAKGLDSCCHRGPSTLDHSTLMRSATLPVVFLRGCGLPDVLIEYLPALAAEPIQFYSCFISYSSSDKEFAERLYADLQSKGIRCWFAPHSVRAGKKLHEQINSAIRLYDRLLLILSLDSMNSEWVKHEIAQAREKEVKQERQVLFPVRIVPFGALRDWECFDADCGKDSAREIREYFIPDFSNWKNHDEYVKAFGQLVRDLDGGSRPHSSAAAQPGS
jgi:hypothetical protein